MKTISEQCGWTGTALCAREREVACEFMSRRSQRQGVRKVTGMRAAGGWVHCIMAGFKI